MHLSGGERHDGPVRDEFPRTPLLMDRALMNAMKPVVLQKSGAMNDSSTQEKP